MTGAEGAHGPKGSSGEENSGTFGTKCPLCPTGVVEAVHALLDVDLRGVRAKLWQDEPGDVRWFVEAGGVAAMEAHGWHMETWSDGRCWVEAMDDDTPEGDRWFADCCVEVEGPGVSLAEADGSYRAWLIAERLHHPWRYADRRNGLSEPAYAPSGRRYLKARGVKTKRVEGTTRFIGIGVRP